MTVIMTGDSVIIVSVAISKIPLENRLIVATVSVINAVCKHTASLHSKRVEELTKCPMKYERMRNCQLKLAEFYSSS